MPLNEKEREELAKKINQQRRAMWKGEATKDRPAKKEQEYKEIKPSSVPYKQPVEMEPEEKPIEIKPPSIPYKQTVEAEPAEEHREVQQPPIKVDEKEELTKKIKEQRKSVWSGEPGVKNKQKKGKSRSTRRILDYQQSSEPAKSSNVSQTDEPEAEEKSRDYKPKIPTLKLAIIVVLGLIGAIAIGVGIGYILASQNLINI